MGLIPSGVKALFWDNDGVLIDSEKLFFQANQEALGRIGVSLNEDMFRTFSLTRGESVLALACDYGSSLDDVESLRLWRDKRYTSLLDGGVALCPHVEKVVPVLASRFLMGVVTTTYSRDFYMAHKHFKLMEYFAFVLTRESYKRSKPFPDPYLMAMDKCGVTQKECLAIEDSPRGYEAAIAAGIDCVVVPNPYCKDYDFSKALAVLPSLGEIC